jgi:alpha-L-fucosidase 2
MRGWAPIHAEPIYRDVKSDVVYDLRNGMRFSSVLKVLSTDGQKSVADTTLKIRGASKVVLLLSMATSFNGYDKNPGTNGKDERALIEAYLKKASKKTFEILLTEHKKDFRKYFDRVSIDFGKKTGNELPTIDRLNRFSSGNSDNNLIALFYQYSRYLLISSSRPGGMPINLQGLWNQELRPPWSSNYTITLYCKNH